MAQRAQGLAEQFVKANGDLVATVSAAPTPSGGP
jgi:hypothetical protein